MSGNKLDLERIVFIGRTFEEYLRMFNLQPGELGGRSILDCPAGACSFTSEAHKLGAASVAADIAYYYSAEALRDKGLKDIEHTVQQLDKVQDNFVWKEFTSIHALQQARTAALAASTLDRQQNSSRYIPVELPLLPFADRSFDLTLSAHFLFMYGDRLDYDFHLRTLQELMRVTKSEIRIFPLVDLSSRRYHKLERLVCAAQAQGWTAEEQQVPYEFQKGADSMLRLLRV
ncbi:SAM-dependent methyltransferase [Paenibacillus graminis]|uniref:SAM-dependent methyltransferase n=1 Tax=Paenibacillus graminis TaxID=189425 RepID=A0A089M7V4_9BACL|nr:SAM-dependent methyltransferase [Paenibacillus graminis]AIQ68400.1 SAM-dependent methyltransferase [Paenibacillus graminis]